MCCCMAIYEFVWPMMVDRNPTQHVCVYTTPLHVCPCLHLFTQNALTSAYESPNGEVAYKEIGKMVEKLGDPFTRIVPPSYVVWE